MTTLALSQLVHRTPAFLHRLSQHFSDFLAGIHEARQLAHRFKVLSQMTDAELAARGLTRDQIPQAVVDRRVRA